MACVLHLAYREAAHANGVAIDAKGAVERYGDRARRMVDAALQALSRPRTEWNYEDMKLHSQVALVLTEYRINTTMAKRAKGLEMDGLIQHSGLMIDEIGGENERP